MSSDNEENGMTHYEEPETRVQVLTTTGAVALAKSEVESQLDAAHRYPRSITKFMRDAQTMATLDVEVAQSCIYALPRGGKTISGPSIRMAEICASAWGNLHLAARVVGVEDTEIIAQGGAWDLERNTRYSVENRRRITNKNGGRYNEDMITTTGNAAASIALRNAVFRAIPRAYVDKLYAIVRKVAVGDATTLATRRAQVLERLGKMGADQARVLHALGKKGVEDIGLDELEVLIGYGTAIRDKEKTVDELFPPVPVTPPAGASEEQGRRMSLGTRGKKAEGASDGEAKAADTKAPEAQPTDVKPAEPQAEAKSEPTPVPEPQKNPKPEPRVPLSEMSPKERKELEAQVKAWEERNK